MFKGIRAQLFFGFGALVLVINLFYSRLTYLFVEVTADAVASWAIDRQLPLAEQLPVGLKHIKEQEFLILTAQDVKQLSTLDQAPYELNLMRFGYQGTQGYLRSLSDNEYIVLNGQSLFPLSRFSSVFGVFVSSIAAAVILLAIMSTWFIASRLSAPLRRLSHTIAEQQPGTLCRTEQANRQDEIGQLANAFEQTYGELQQAWRREHDFASDVSHELRTPIALIRNTLALNEQGMLDSQDKQLLEQSTNTLQNTVEVLLALARKENLVFSPQALLPLIERNVLALHHAHSAQGFEVNIDIHPDVRVVGNGHLIGLLCQNLINNGFYHSGSNGMRVYQHGINLVFENPVNPASQQQNYQGLGHGQYLVRRIAGVMGWQLAVKSDAQYYRVTVTPILCPDN